MNPYSIDVSWIGPKYFENIKNYIIFFRGSRITVSPSPDTLNYFTQLHHLLPDTEYKLKVVAVLKNGQRDEVELFAHTKKKGMLLVCKMQYYMTRNVITYSFSTKAQNFEHLHKNNNTSDFNLQNQRQYI